MRDSQASNSRPSSGTSPLSILVVEDHHRQLAHLIIQFRVIGITPLTAATGHEAIRIAATEHPDVVFLDGLLPQMHGFEVARFLKNLDSCYHPFIVLMTSVYRNVRYRNEAQLKYGVDLYVEKPLTPELLLMILERVVQAPVEVIP